MRRAHVYTSNDKKLFSIEFHRIELYRPDDSERGAGIDPTLVDRSVTISIQPVSQSAGRARMKVEGQDLLWRNRREEGMRASDNAGYPLIEASF